MRGIGCLQRHSIFFFSTASLLLPSECHTRARIWFARATTFGKKIPILLAILSGSGIDKKRTLCPAPLIATKSPRLRHSISYQNWSDIRKRQNHFTAQAPGHRVRRCYRSCNSSSAVEPFSPTTHLAGQAI